MTTPTHLIGMRADLMHAARADVRAGSPAPGQDPAGRRCRRGGGRDRALTVGLPSGSNGGAPQVDSSLAGVLKAASINAAGQPALPIPGPGHYYHFTDTELGYLSKIGPNTPQEGCFTSCPPLPANWGIKAWVTSTMWISADGTALRHDRHRQAVIRNAQVRADLAAGRYAGASLSNPMGAAHATFFPKGVSSGWTFGDMTLKQVYALPSDPAKLERIVRRLSQGTKNPLRPRCSRSSAT